MVTGPRELLGAVVENGSNTELAAWAATGREGLLVLRDELTGRVPTPWKGVHPKDAIDGLSAAAAAIAAKHPAEFLEVFADARFDSDGFVLVGLGQIDDDRATERLVRAATARSQWSRMDAAIGLGRRRSPQAVDALVALLHDREYLVRYHSLRSLRAIGDARAIEALRGFRAPSDLERNLADSAIRSITRRIGPSASDAESP